jgi:hypothetical protein
VIISKVLKSLKVKPCPVCGKTDQIRITFSLEQGEAEYLLVDNSWEEIYHDEEDKGEEATIEEYDIWCGRCGGEGHQPYENV